MKSFVYSSIVVVVLLLCYPSFSKGQEKSVNPAFIGHGVFLGETPALRDLPPMTEEEYIRMAEKAKQKLNNEDLEYRSYPYAETALPKGPDEAWQRSMGTHNLPKAPIVNFSGQTSSYYPSDCNGTAGPNYYMQTINCSYAIYNKQTGALVAGPTAMNTLFSGTTGSTYNDGDPIILFDEQASRWLAVEFSISGSNDYMLIAVSTTNDPTGTWYKYSFDVADMPDYEKFGIWQDGYYMGVNNSSGNDIYVFQRSVMLTGGASPTMIGFDNPYRPTTIDGFVCVPPVDNDGIAAPAGAPGTFIAFNDDAIGGGSDQLWIYELNANWTTPASSTFARVQQISVTAFDSNFGNNWDNITQPNTQKLDAIPQVIMNAPQYRNFGTYQTIVCCHTVDVDATNHAGIRWYELRRGTQTSGNWTIRQQGTYAPDSHSRWMGSIMLNGSGKIALGYSISSSTVYPGIRYTGQSASAYSSGSGVMDIPEEIIQTATTAQTSYNRWGDYSLMSVDPTDDQTFWFTTQYGGSRQSKIASFKFGNDPSVTTLPATSVTSVSAVLNGTVNPNSLSTTYYFQWGTSTSYSNATSSLSAGSGTTTVAVNASISSLISGTTYHFRLVAINSDGTSYGSDLTFTPGAASVTTTAASVITLSTATSGGNVITDGGSTVTARGVCWATTSNPTITGNHTTDGSGIGTFTSQITGLSSNTAYHIRAYATNANGTFYGDDLTFTTLCGIFSLPFTESFSGTTIPSCWSQLDNQGSGQVWQFGTITGYSPNPSLTGNYAYLNSDAYGSGSSQNADLITPTLDLSTFTNVTLQFQHYFRSYSGSSGTLSYSINNGSSWTTIQTYTTTTSNPASFSQVISAVAGYSQVKFKWNYTGTYGYYWAIDNVQISGTASTTLSVTPSNQNVMPAAGSTSFTVSSNSSWTASSDQSWCTVTSSGTGNGTIIANYTANTGSTQRSATITITVTGLTPQTVTVTQAAPSLTVTPSNQSVGNSSGSTSFTVTSNTGWTASSDQLWCISTAAGSGSGTITADYEENTLVAQRIATIIVAVTGLSPVSVTVTQAAAPSTLSVTPSNQNVSDVAGNTTFSVTSNSTWTVSSDQVWCTVTPAGSGNGSVSANYSQNLSVDSRVANITITVSGLSPIIVTVTQAGAAPLLSVTPSNQNVSDAAGNTTFNVTSNTAWTVTSDQAWCIVTPAGSGNGSVSASFTQNLSSELRIANITITVSELAPVIVTVTQAGALIKQLTITAFPESYFNGTNLAQVQKVDETGEPTNNFDGQIVDTLSIFLASPVMPWEFLFGIHSVSLNTNGLITVNIPPLFSSSYYIVLKHRQSIETWSMNPVLFSGSDINYNFTTSADRAFGNNLKDLTGNGTIWGIYTGDMNQDGFVELDDVNAVYTAQRNSFSGYYIWDINGNGFVELDDVNKVYSNNRNSVGSHNPANP